MRREDYIMRLIESLQGLLPYILDLVKSGAYHEAHAIIDQNLREMTGLGSKGLIGLDDEALLGLLQRDGQLNWREKAVFTATLLGEDADIYAERNHFGDSYDRYLQALHLFLHLALDPEVGGDGRDVTPEITAISEKLAEYHLPGRALSLLMRYHEQRDEFAAAEDALYDWLEADPALALPDHPNPLAEGRQFYARLQRLSDAALKAGGLPRDEVEAGMVELAQYLDD